MTDPLSEVLKNNPSRLNLTHYFATFWKKLQKLAEIKRMDAERCQKWSNDQLRSDGQRLLGDLPPKSKRFSFQHLTLNLKKDNDGWESSSHKAALLAHRGRCGDVVTAKAGCVSKQELPALCIAALALQSVILLSFSSYLPACLSPLSLPLSLLLLFFFLSRQLFSAFAICNNKKRTPLNRNSCCRIILCALVCFLILTDFNSGRFHGELLIHVVIV